MTAILFWAVIVTVVGWWGVRQTVYTLACPTCARGWKSPVPQGVCGRCGRVATARGQYEQIELEGRS